MDNDPGPTGLPNCPICGEPMQTRPSLDGTGLVAICVDCPNAPILPLPPPDGPVSPKASATPGGTPMRFRDILASSGGTPPPGALPDSLLEDLPAEARNLLSGAPAKHKPAERRPPGLRDEDRRALLDQGLVISEDARGIRITGLPVSGRGPSTGRLSPTDIIRLAADLDGGVPPPEKRVRCPKCDAVLPDNLQRCPWCGQALPPAGSSSPAV